VYFFSSLIVLSLIVFIASLIVFSWQV